MGTRQSEHITPALHDLHWLPVRKRFRYKLAILAYRALSGQPQDYLDDRSFTAAWNDSPQVLCDYSKHSRNTNALICSLYREATTHFRQFDFNALVINELIYFT